MHKVSNSSEMRRRGAPSSGNQVRVSSPHRQIDRQTDVQTAVERQVFCTVCGPMLSTYARVTTVNVDFTLNMDCIFSIRSMYTN